MTHSSTSTAPRASFRAVHRRLRAIAAVLVAVAASLGVASALHLSGQVTGSPPFDPDHAGIAEAVIGLVLVIGAVAMVRTPARGRRAGLLAVSFAIVGFIVGLSFTLQGGHVPDVAFHVVGLPVLVLSWVALARTRQGSSRPA
jgi:O-antigen/teichoic acid export membrane protein